MKKIKIKKTSLENKTQQQHFYTYTCHWFPNRVPWAVRQLLMCCGILLQQFIIIAIYISSIEWVYNYHLYTLISQNRGKFFSLKEHLWTKKELKGNAYRVTDNKC